MVHSGASKPLSLLHGLPTPSCLPSPVVLLVIWSKHALRMLPLLAISTRVRLLHWAPALQPMDLKMRTFWA